MYEGRLDDGLARVAEPLLGRLPSATQAITELAGLDRQAQELVRHWAEVIALSSEDLAARFLAQAGVACGALDRASFEDWIVEAMDAFDNRSLGAAIQVLESLPGRIESAANARLGCALDSVAPFLRYFVRHNYHTSR